MVYWMSFHLKDDNTYDERWEALMETAKSFGRYWLETTSFVVFSSSHDIDAVMDSLAAGLKSDRDLLLLRAMDTKTARIFGNYRDDDIFVLMDYLKVSS